MITTALVLALLVAGEKDEWKAAPGKAVPAKAAAGKKKDEPVAAPPPPPAAAPAPELSPEGKLKLTDANGRNNARDYASALALLNPLATEFPQVAEVFAARCSTLLGQQQWKLAQADCAYTLTLKPLPNAIYGLAVAEDGQGRYAEALEHYRQASERPETSEPVRQLATSRIAVLKARLGPNGVPGSTVRLPQCSGADMDDAENGMRLNMGHVDRCGTAWFKSPVDQVFKAVEQALGSLGYGVTVSKYDRGLLMTNIFSIDEQAYARGYRSATFVRVGRQYEIMVQPSNDGWVRVRATPHAYENGAEVSQQEIWRLEGQWGELPRWRSLFGRIQQLL